MASSVLAPTEEYHLSLKATEAVHLVSENFSNNGAGSPKQLIGEALKARVEAVDHDNCSVGDEDAFFVADLGEVYRQHLRWKKNLPRVKPHYGESFPYIAECMLGHF
jgi:ornithine decarboxylase